MELDRRQVLAGGSACLAACAAGSGGARPEAESALDPLLAAHAEVLPERPGAGANHYPMAAEALEALGHPEAIAEDWRRGAAGYAGALPRGAALEAASEAELARALGDPARFGDWRARFRAELAREPWRAVVARWAPRLAPGLAGAVCHGLIRTAHAARALGVRDAAARRNELAAGLAYWAARYTVLPAAPARAGGPASAAETLATLEHPRLAELDEVGFFAVTERLTRAPLAPPPVLEGPDAPAVELERLVDAAATAFLEMLVLERHRLWLLHTVTAPAAVGLLLPALDEAGARVLVAHARQAVVALHAAFGAPYAPRPHVRAAPPPWPELIERAVASRSVHTIKLIEALRRFDRGDDPLWRTVAAQWLEWA